jgi:hypothetical protein
VLQFKAGRAEQGYSAQRRLGSGFSALAAALPLISMIYERWGFDTLFYVLSAAAP